MVPRDIGICYGKLVRHFLISSCSPLVGMVPHAVDVLEVSHGGCPIGRAHAASAVGH